VELDVRRASLLHGFNVHCGTASDRAQAQFPALRKGYHAQHNVLYLGMHDEIFHFEIQDPFFEIFHEIFNFYYEVT